MAYFTRSRMETMVLELYRANDRFAKGATENRKKDLQVLIDCQQKALVLGEYLESMGMDYSGIVSMFEEYCNHIYAMAENLDNDAIVIDHQLDVGNLLITTLDIIRQRIVEINRIDIYDFRNLVETNREKKLVEKEINRLYDSCFEKDGPLVTGEENFRPLAVGTY